jgi:hypothetical protein
MTSKDVDFILGQNKKRFIRMFDASLPGPSNKDSIEMEILELLFVVTCRKRSRNPVTNPNLVYSHSIT